MTELAIPEKSINQLAKEQIDQLDSEKIQLEQLQKYYDYLPDSLGYEKFKILSDVNEAKRALYQSFIIAQKRAKTADSLG